MSIWGAIGSIGSTLLGGLFGRKKQSTSNTVDYVSMVRNAEAAGFNPLTALRNGGAAGFTTSTTAAAPLSNVIGQGLADGVGKFLETFDPHADKMREKTYALLDAQVRNLDAQSGAIFPAMPGGFHTPGTYGGTFEGRPSGRAGQLSASSAPLPASAGHAMTPTVETPTLTNPYGQSTGLTIDTKMPDAAAAEERYGDVLSNVFGVANFYQDAYGNFKRWADDARKSGEPATVLPALRRNATSWWR